MNYGERTSCSGAVHATVSSLRLLSFCVLLYCWYSVCVVLTWCYSVAPVVIRSDAICGGICRVTGITVLVSHGTSIMMCHCVVSHSIKTWQCFYVLCCSLECVVYWNLWVYFYRFFFLRGRREIIFSAFLNVKKSCNHPTLALYPCTVVTTLFN